MKIQGTILLADDEETFRESTSRLLQREGFECYGASDTDQAIACLRQRQFDLLLADIRMPRNPELRVVREAHDIDRQMAIILITGYPSMETAIRSVEMSVSAYLTKPLDYEDLLRHVVSAVERSRRRRLVTGVSERLETVLGDVRTVAAQPLADQDAANDVRMSTIRTLASCLSDLLSIATPAGGDQRLPFLCEMLDCPRQPAHREAIAHAIDVLKKTKDTFKSKVLAGLRAELERSIGESCTDRIEC